MGWMLYIHLYLKVINLHKHKHEQKHRTKTLFPDDILQHESFNCLNNHDWYLVCSLTCTQETISCISCVTCARKRTFRIRASCLSMAWIISAFIYIYTNWFKTIKYNTTTILDLWVPETFIVCFFHTYRPTWMMILLVS